MAYCTPQDVITYCSWPAFGLLPEDAQGNFIEAASDLIDRVTWRKYGISQASIAEVFDGDGQESLWLSLRPVISIASILINDWPLDNSGGWAWTLNGATGKLVRGGGHEDPRFGLRWPHGSQNILVQYWGGAANIPSFIAVATAWTVRYFRDQGAVSGAYDSETIGRYSYSLRKQPLTGGLPDHIMGLLNSVNNATFA